MSSAKRISDEISNESRETKDELTSNYSLTKLF